MGKNKVVKKLKNLAVRLAIGMKKADNLIISSNLERLPETSSDKVNPIYHRNNFLRGIQLGKLTEEQKQRHYEVLAAMDYIHGKTELGYKEVDVYNEKTKRWTKEMVEVAVPLDAKTIEYNESKKQKIGDFIEGYKIVLFLKNKLINIDLYNTKETLKIYREDNFHGYLKIEQYCENIFVKIKNEQDFDKDKKCIVEFYCQNQLIDNINDYDLEKENDKIYNDVYNSAINNINGFTNFNKFDIVETTATKNDIIHTFEINSFLEIKKLNKEFVVKFNCTKLI